MKRLPLGIALGTGALLLTACGQTDTGADGDANSLLRYIPADTPFVMASIEPIPQQLNDVYLERAEPFIAQMEATLSGLRDDLANDADGSENPEAAAVADAVLAEFDGNLNREGLESLGIALEQVGAIYGHGLFPVMRMGLGDPALVQAMIDRVQAKAGVSIPVNNFQGKDYWRAGGNDEPMALYVAMLEDHIAFTSGPVSLEAEFLPALLGLELPERSIADSGALTALNEEKGYGPYGSGYIKLDRVADELFDADSLTVRWMTDMGTYDLAAIDPACAQEARLVTAFVPRLVAGVTELTEDRFGMRYQVETNAWLGGQLERLVGEVPPAPSDSDRMLSLSLNLQMGRVTTFLRDSANGMVAQPFQCPQLNRLNAQLQQMAGMVNQPMPPFIGNLNGLRVELSELDPANPSPDTVKGRIALEMESPQMVIGMASMMIPGFEELNIEPGADPVAVPQELMTIQTPELEAHAVMSNDAIGISLGQGEKDQLRAFLDASGDADGVFLSVDYDAALLARLQRENLPDAADASPIDAAAMAEMNALSESYENLLGRTRFDLSLSEQGLTIDNVQAFK
ncbi:MAG: hypothetical protein AAGH19_02660 [Pseudomonadota bacterium]